MPYPLQPLQASCTRVLGRAGPGAAQQGRHGSIHEARITLGGGESRLASASGGCLLSWSGSVPLSTAACCTHALKSRLFERHIEANSRLDWRDIPGFNSLLRWRRIFDTSCDDTKPPRSRSWFVHNGLCRKARVPREIESVRGWAVFEHAFIVASSQCSLRIGQHNSLASPPLHLGHAHAHERFERHRAILLA